MEPSGAGNEQLVFSLVSLILLAIPFQQIFHKAGFSRAWTLLLILGPIGWLACWLFLALREWPAQRDG